MQLNTAPELFSRRLLESDGSSEEEKGCDERRRGGSRRNQDEKGGGGCEEEDQDGEDPEEEPEETPYMNMTLLRVFACSPGYCLKNSTCIEGSTGVLCSLCEPNHAMSSGVCSLCESDVDMDLLRTIVLVVFCLGLLLGWLVICCKTLLPMVQGLIAKVSSLPTTLIFIPKTCHQYLAVYL